MGWSSGLQAALPDRGRLDRRPAQRAPHVPGLPLQHHARSRVVPLTMLTEANWEFAREALEDYAEPPAPALQGLGRLPPSRRPRTWTCRRPREAGAAAGCPLAQLALQ